MPAVPTSCCRCCEWYSPRAAPCLSPSHVQHSVCVSEHEKYALGATKPGGFAANGFSAPVQGGQKPADNEPAGLEFLSTRPPWRCRCVGSSTAVDNACNMTCVCCAALREDSMHAVWSGRRRAVTHRSCAGFEGSRSMPATYPTPCPILCTYAAYATSTAPAARRCCHTPRASSTSAGRVQPPLLQTVALRRPQRHSSSPHSPPR